MKRYLTIVLFLFITYNGLTQIDHFFSGGWNFMYATNKGFNTIIDHFNNRQPQIAQPMKHLNYVNGFSLTFGKKISDRLFTQYRFKISGNSQHAKVYQIDSIIGERRIGFRSFSSEFDLGYHLFSPYNHNLIFGISVMQEWIKLYTSTSGRNYNEIQHGLSLSGFLTYIIPFSSNEKSLGLACRIYYQYSILPYSVKNIDNEVNNTHLIGKIDFLSTKQLI